MKRMSKIVVRVIAGLFLVTLAPAVMADMGEGPRHGRRRTAISVLQLKNTDWPSSSTDYARVTESLSFDVGIGNAQWGYGFASAEMTGVKDLNLVVQTSGDFKHYDANSFAGFIIDYSTAQGYSHRVMLGIGMLDNGRWQHDYYSDMKPANVQYVDLGAGRHYRLDVERWAPSGWDGKFWFTAGIQNAGENGYIRASIRGAR